MFTNIAPIPKLAVVRFYT